MKESRTILWGAASLSILLLTLFGVAGCATRGEIKRFQAQLDSLSVANTMQSRQIAYLDSVLIENAQLLRTIRAEQNANMNALQEEMRIVEAIMRDSGFKVSSLTDKIESLQDDVSRRQVETDTADTGEFDIEARGDELYSTALHDLNQGKYDLAIMGFESYLEKFPDGARADDSRYNIGEALLAKAEYAEAALNYLTVTRKWPGSILVSAALYKAGRCYEYMGQNEMAKRYYEQLIDEHAGSAEAELAKQRLKAFED